MKEILSHLVYWHWFALAVILGILDVVAGANFFFVWCGFAAAFVGLLMLVIPQMLWEYQLLIFGIGILASLVIWRRYAQKRFHQEAKSHLNRRAEQYIGRIFTLEEPIINGRGKVRVDDTLWRVEGEDMPVGTKVKVAGVDGVVFKVVKQNNIV